MKEMQTQREELACQTLKWETQFQFDDVNETSSLPVLTHDCSELSERKEQW